MNLKGSFLIFVLVMAATLALDLERILSQAEADIKEGSIEERPIIFHGKKVTEQAMAKRGSLFRKMVKSIKDEGLSLDESKNLARRSIRRMRGKFMVSGQFGLTRPVEMVDNVCMGMPVTCNASSPFRTLTGLCNNLNNPYQGAISTKFGRDIPVTEEFDPEEDFNIFLDPVRARELDREEHQDRGIGIGISIGDGQAFIPIFLDVSHGHKQMCPPRRDLPGARLVSNTFHTDQDLPSDKITTMVMQFGQFLDHDLDLTAEYEAHGCCTDEPDDPDGDCFPIHVSENDPFYGPRSVNCLEFVKSVDFCEENGGPKELANAITHFIDGSNIYGSDEPSGSQLRSFNGGKLLTATYGLLPLVDGVEIAGDPRALEMPGLAAMHTLWVREHNRVAIEIWKVHPEWNDETIFQHARRIVVAEYQNVIYGEFLPILLGSRNMRGMELSEEGSLYNSLVDFAVTNEFATASFRFGHSLINPTVQRFALDNSGIVSEFRLRDQFFNTDLYRSENGRAMEQMLFGLANQKAQTNDRQFTQDVTNFLFQEDGHDFGEDLIARNIQRGRDHGMAGFCCYYRIFVDPRFDCNSGWERRYQGISQESWNILRTVYKRPSDIDLFVGGFAQAAFNGGLTGEVILKMNANVFLQAKFGDRFFFTHRGQAGSFTTPGRALILKRTMSSILCDNIGVQKVPVNSFVVTKSTDFVPCSSVPKLNKDNLQELLKFE